MMKKMEPIVSLCFDFLRQKSGRKMDSAFIEAGFICVQAEIVLFSITFGSDCYESLLEFYSSDDCRREVVKRTEFTRDTFSEHEGTDKIDSLVSLLITERGIPSESKYSVLRRYAPGILDEIFSLQRRSQRTGTLPPLARTTPGSTPALFSPEMP